MIVGNEYLLYDTNIRAPDKMRKFVKLKKKKTFTVNPK